MPSVGPGHSAHPLFAECLRADTRHTSNTRHSMSVPSVETKTLGTSLLCRVSGSPTRHTWTGGSPRWLPSLFAECTPLALGKHIFVPSVVDWTLGTWALCRVSFVDTRQTDFPNLEFELQIFYVVLIH